MATKKSAGAPAQAADACEALLDEMRGTMSSGQLALEALGLYRASGLQPPEWALAEIEECYGAFKSGAPSAGWTAIDLRPNGLAHHTLGEAFGVEPRSDHRNAAHIRGAFMPRIVGMFTGPNRLSRSDKGYQEASDRLGITVNQVRELVRRLPKG